MLPKDKLLISKLRRRICYLIILSFLLSYWVVQNYYSIDFYQSENSMYCREILEKDKEISNLKILIKSNESKSPKITKKVKPLNKIKKVIKEESKQIIDTLTNQDQIENAIDPVILDTIKLKI